MATQCVQCNKKVGLFKKPIEGIYCSYDCRNAAREEVDRRRAEAAERARAEIERVEEETEQRRNSEIIQRQRLEDHSACPKCGEAWAARIGAGSLGQDQGECRRCGFKAEFVQVEACPHCRCQSLVVSANGEGRCPRCKTRVDSARQIA
jgi:predicted RNA-binding Zn-ribbon protein involved in translation (DUF1610 family)